MSLLDFLFPKYCVNCKKIGSYLCANCFAFISFDISSICTVCNRASLDGITHPGCKSRYVLDGNFSSIAYKGVVKKLLYTFKYKPYLSDLQKVLGDLFYEGIIQNESFMTIIKQLKNQTIIAVPIPLHSSRLKTRGYNQAEILAKDLANRFNIKTINLLTRSRPTTAQFGLKRKDRLENIKNAFSLIPNITVSQYPNILLVDDLLTTGATLAEACYVLKKAGVKRVFGLTLAKD